MSKIPALLDALVTAFRAAPALRDVEVTDGPQMSNSGASDWVCVGWDGDPEGDYLAASVELDWTSLGTGRGESIDVPVVVLVSRGSTEIKPARDAAFAYYDAISAVFRDPTLGIPQVQAFVGMNGLYQVQDDKGVHARLSLAIRCNSLG